MAAKIRVLIVDDHPFIREGVRFYLQDEPDFEIVGEAEDGQEAIAKAVQLHPDIVVMDLRMALMDGVEATRCVREVLPSTQVLILSVEKRDDLLHSALEAGAAGWIPKNSSPAQFIEALKTVSQGKPLEQQQI